LSEFHLDDSIHGVAMSAGYTLFAVGNRHELVVYDISNVYAPEEVNSISNPDGVPHADLHLVGETFVSLTTDAIHLGNVHGVDWQTLSTNAIDIATDDKYIYLLNDSTIEIRPVDDWENPATEYFHTLDTPQKLTLTRQRLVAMGSGRLELILTGRIESTGQMEMLGARNVNNPVDIAVSGELLALISSDTGSRQLVLYDMETSGTDASFLNEIARVYSSYGFYGAHQLTFSDDLLEWQIGSRYYNLRVPLLNTVGVVPRRYLVADNDLIAV
jgi:hypothetical protein